MKKNADNVNGIKIEEVSKTAKEDRLAYYRDLQITLSSAEGMLAKEIADGLGDEKSVRFYISVCYEYSERYVREVYEFVRKVPDVKIKRSRGALFAYLIRKYEHFDSDD